MNIIYRYKSYIVEFIKLVVISSAIIIPIRYFLIQPFIVNGASMEESFYDKEYLIIDEISYRFREPARGDVVVFKYPKDPSQFFIKRVIGLPGEVVELRNGYVFIYDEQTQTETVLDETAYLNSETLTYPDKTYKLRENEYFVLGDNRTSSLDSRIFGPLNKDFIIGRVWVRGWPFNRLSLFSQINYDNF